jgi:small subunit ribosomal protein S20
VANTKTAKKQLLNTKRNHLRNQRYKTTLKNALKTARAAIVAGGDPGAAQEAVNSAVKTLYRSASKGVIKRQNASRRVSRIMLAYDRKFRADKGPAPSA